MAQFISVHMLTKCVVFTAIQSMFEKRILKCAKDVLEDTSQPLKDRFRGTPVCHCVIEGMLYSVTGCLKKEII